MEPNIMVRVISGVLCIVVLAFLVQRRRTRAK